ncbi:MAG: hypothetical protein JO103_01165 [Candidatus Eremiobacteraeota bacterium]|nr:hypothetical protein [Candidatus Eremiobacteraeota bacterium]
MAYRDDAGDSLEAPTSEGPLRAALGPARVDLRVADRSLHVADRNATLVAGKKKTTLRFEKRLVVARSVPREDLGVWIEHGDEMRRIFGVVPISLLEPEGLAALKKLDAVAHRVRATLADYAGDIVRAVEIGNGHDLDKVLLADRGDGFLVYARKLFRGQARLVMTVHGDGRVEIPDEKVIRVTSRYGVTVRGDYLRFADQHGTDLARVAIPWLAPEDRDELARRIGQLVDRPG